MSESKVLDLCKLASEEWKKAFNSQDAAGCARQYTSNARMNAQPFGEHKGTEEIQGFWQKIIDGGYDSVNYKNIKWQQVNDNSYILSADWTMNKAHGIITKELWVIQEDGTAKLEEDDFEIQG